MRSVPFNLRTLLPYLVVGMRFVLTVFVWHLTTGHAASAGNETVDAGLVFIENTQVRGLIHTKEETIWKLLPRPVPGGFALAELAEFERRIRNLRLFDHVEVTIRDHRVVVDVQEKFKLSLL